MRRSILEAVDRLRQRYPKDKDVLLLCREIEQTIFNVAVTPAAPKKKARKKR